jgi:light-harvesting complex 1 beta chain
MSKSITHAPAAYSEMSSLAGFRGIFIVTFVLFLFVALLAMVCWQNWRTLLPGAEGARSLVGGVKSAVYTVISQLQ